MEDSGLGVVFDMWCGEAVAWARIGAPVQGFLENHAYTHILTVEHAIQKYGPITEWRVGPRGGFRRATFGEKTFSWKGLKYCDPALIPEGVIITED